MQHYIEDLRAWIDVHEEIVRPDLDFAPPYDCFDPIFADEGQDDEYGYVSGDEFNGNPSLADPNDEGDNERTGAIYEDDAA